MNTYNIIITGKVQDISFRSIIENIGRSFGMPGFVFNAKDGSVKILCSGDENVIDNFTQTIKLRGAESGAEIVDITEQLLPPIDLPYNFSKASSDDDIDIGRKLDKANLLLKSGFDNLITDLNQGFNNLTTIMSEHNSCMEKHNLRMDEHNTRMDEHNTRLEAMMQEHNIGQREHNKRLEAILDKIANK